MDAHKARRVGKVVPSNPDGPWLLAQGGRSAHLLYSGFSPTPVLQFESGSRPVHQKTLVKDCQTVKEKIYKLVDPLGEGDPSVSHKLQINDKSLKTERL